VYYTGVAFNIQSGAPVQPVVVFVAKFAHDGSTYLGTTIVPGQNLTDKPWVAVDHSGGPNDGNIYVDFFGCCTSDGRFTTLLSRSTNGGGTFSTPIVLPVQACCFPTGLTVDPSGNIFAISEHGGSSFALDIIVTKSTDGGMSFVAPVIAVHATSYPDPIPGNKFRASTLAQIAASSRGVYVTWDDGAMSGINVLFIRSTDGGSTWSSPIRVNDEAVGEHFFPTIAVSGSVISIAWYDSRLSGNSSVIKALDVFYARSIDAGVTFSANLRITSVSFDPNVILRTDAPGANMPFMGDYIDIAASSTAVHPIWTDNRNACDTVDPTFGCIDQDAFTATITF